MFDLKKVVLIGGVLLAGCVRPQATDSRGHELLSGKDTVLLEKSGVVYTCPMHPQVRSARSGKCPVCGMQLVPVKNNPPPVGQAGGTVARAIVLSPREQQLAGIRIDTAKRKVLKDEVVLTGTTIFNPAQQQVVSAWVGGWIKRMYVRNPGERVTVGQKLYDLYSPELLSAEKDYMLALQQKRLFKKASVDFTATLQAMKQKLLRWGLSAAAIDDLEHTGPTGYVTIYSRTSGYMTGKIREEGDYVKEGDAVLNLTENSTLWVQAQLYDQELPLLRQHPQIAVALPAFPGKQRSGTLVFRNPVNEKDGRVHLLHIAIANPDGRIQPGMLAYVYLQTAQGSPQTVVPKSSVIYGEKADYIWIARSGHTFVRRKVQLGEDNAFLVAVRDGIQPGDKVVSGGSYLLNSAYILRYGTGVNRMGMQRSDMKMKGKSTEPHE